MKKILLLGALLLLASFGSVSTVNAQAFQKGGFYLTLGLESGTVRHTHHHANNISNNYGSFANGLNLRGEWGIHDYVGLGFYTGVQGGRHWYGNHYGYNHGFLSIPLGIQANFHFYQLIADKTGKNIHADKLDVYGGIYAGSGLAFLFNTNYNKGNVGALGFAGTQVGVRFFFTEKIGVNLEVSGGWGRSSGAVGVVFRM